MYERRMETGWLTTNPIRIDLATVGNGVKNIRLVFQIVEMLDDERRSILRGILILRHTSISENMFEMVSCKCVARSKMLVLSGTIRPSN
jgi:hypothetical protein